MLKFRPQVITPILFVLSSINASYGQQNQWQEDLIEVSLNNEYHVILGPKSIYEAQWNNISQPLFWKEIMALSPDSVIINVASTRQNLGTYHYKTWISKSEASKSVFKDSLKTANNLPKETRINVTTGKNDFYRFDLVFESLPKGVACFEEFGVDPWYAQSILLIESPGQLAKSTAGAYGPFQLMPGVARQYGLTVNTKVDERKDFNRSAYAAAKLISTTCIPYARSIAESAGLTIDESALWFRLLTMHVYHAGAGNVRAVVNACGRQESGEDLIKKMWVTTAASFGNSSQNYSQLALAAHLKLEEIILEHKYPIYDCPEFLN
jgi:hypothetical protein